MTVPDDNQTGSAQPLANLPAASPFEQQVNGVFGLLEADTQARSEISPFTRAERIAAGFTVLGVLLVWGGLLLQLRGLVITGSALLALMLVINVRMAAQSVSRPGVGYAAAIRASAGRQVGVVQKLHELPPVVLEEATTFLNQRLQAAEEGMILLAGPMKTIGLGGTVVSLLAVGTALETWLPALHNDTTFVFLFGAAVLGWIIGLERAEAGLSHLRINRDMLLRARALQAAKSP